MHSKPHDFSDEHHYRLTNIELLRILAMLMIVFHHFAYHGEFDFATDVIGINRLWIQFIQLGGRIGVNVFVIISGYFLVCKESVRTDRVIQLWGKIFFYSIVAFILFTVTGVIPFSIKELIKHIAPITFDQWWFASAYFVLYLISPYLNKLLRSFDKKQYKSFLLLILCCWCIIPTLTHRTFQSNNFVWMIVVYSFAGYLKIFGTDIKGTGRRFLGFAGLGYMIVFASAVLFDVIGIKIPFFSSHATFFYDMQSFPVLLIAIFMFLGFVNINVHYGKCINLISSAMFGVYLIHENSYVRPFLWKTIFNIGSFSNSNVLIPYTIFVTICVFVGCTAVEILRIYLIEKHLATTMDKIATCLEKGKDILLQRILNK